MMLEPLGEVGANFSLQLSSRTQFTKINNKKVNAENQCEKHKKSSLNTAHFVTFSKQDTREIGRSIETDDVSPFLYIAHTKASFHVSGKIPRLKELFFLLKLFWPLYTETKF